MNIYTSHSLAETKKIAHDWLQEVTKTHANQNEALVVGLSGHLGAGKTAFVKLLAEILGVTEEVTSPTFVIMKMYNATDLRWKHLIHIDAYRLEKREELEALQFESLVSDPSNLIVMEWPENVGYTKFPPQTHLEFEATETTHTINVL